MFDQQISIVREVSFISLIDKFIVNDGLLGLLVLGEENMSEMILLFL